MITALAGLRKLKYVQKLDILLELQGIPMVDRCWLDPNFAQNTVTVITGIVYTPSTDNSPCCRARRMETAGVSMDGAGQRTSTVAELVFCIGKPNLSMVDLN